MGFEFTFTDNTDKVIEEFERKEKAVLEAWGQQGSSHARDIVTAAGRIDTGAMRNSITYQVDEGEHAVAIGTNNEYAIFHEMGTGIHLEGGGGRQTPWRYRDAKGQWHTTSGITPIHMIKNAVANFLSEYRAIMEQIF
jgi:hypothetical protein